MNLLFKYRFLYIVLLFYSCASINEMRDTNLKEYKIIINETKIDDLLKKFGMPTEKKKYKYNNEDRVSYLWLFISRRWAIYKSLQVLVIDNKIKAYTFTSNHGEDETYCDINKVDQVKKGMNISEVIEILGKPNGSYEFRINKDDNPYKLQGEFAYYMYYIEIGPVYKVRRKNGDKTWRVKPKKITIMYDKSNIVKSIMSKEVE